MSELAYSFLFKGAYTRDVVSAMAESVHDALDRPARVAFIFATSDYLPYVEELTDIFRIDGHILNVVVCTAGGIIGGAEEYESGSGFSLLAVVEPQGEKSAEFAFVSSEQPDRVWPVDSDDSEGVLLKSFVKECSAGAWLIFADPFVFLSEDWLQSWNACAPETPLVGGLVSGSADAESVGVFLNGRRIEGALLVGLHNKLRLVPAVSQGCRSIGEPLTVTRADSNVVYSLGSHPAYEALESAFETLTDEEKNFARGNLLAGLASSEYVEDFKSGDFLIRSILGADPNSGAVAIGAFPRVGQTMQYQYRDPVVASQDIDKAFSEAAKGIGKPLASLIFACNERGENFFSRKNVDAAALERHFGPHPVAGLFCNGEIGPIRGVNSVNTYSAAAALIIEME